MLSFGLHWAVARGSPAVPWKALSISMSVVLALLLEYEFVLLCLFGKSQKRGLSCSAMSLRILIISLISGGAERSSIGCGVIFAVL